MSLVLEGSVLKAVLPEIERAQRGRRQQTEREAAEDDQQRQPAARRCVYALMCADCMHRRRTIYEHRGVHEVWIVERM